MWLADSITPRQIENADRLLRAQDRTPVAVIGPFGNANDDELTEVAYPPEREMDLGASYHGAFGLVFWRKTDLVRGRHLDLTQELASPDGSGTLAYIAQYVWSPEDMDVYLSVGHQGGIKAWINEISVLQHHGAHRPSGDDAFRGLGRLHQGWNKILLKVESFTGAHIFQFRLVHPDGQPIPALRFSDVQQ